MTTPYMYLYLYIMYHYVMMLVFKRTRAYLGTLQDYFIIIKYRDLSYPIIIIMLDRVLIMAPKKAMSMLAYV